MFLKDHFCKQQIFVYRRIHSCARAHSNEFGLQFSIIAAGGYGVGGFLSSVEILDQGATSWRNGPQLPISIGYGAMVEDPIGEYLGFKNVFNTIQ